LQLGPPIFGLGGVSSTDELIDANVDDPRRDVAQPGSSASQAKLSLRRTQPARTANYYQGHAYREGSRVRVLITAPNGDQPIWSFEKTKPKGKAKVAIAHDGKRPSNLTLPVIPEGEIPTDLPPCPGLKGEPCRDYEPFTQD
jgi:hypothetical protein